MGRAAVSGFPAAVDRWRDGGNWNLGHWLNGRLSGVAVGDLINAILADHGLPPADVRHADGTMLGYVIEDPCSARAALEPVLDLYGIGAREEGGVSSSRGKEPPRPERSR